MEVLPGGGWDNLRNMDMGTVMSLNYSHCRTTEDGEYLIPDDVYVTPQRQSNLDINSEIIENWVYYKDTIADSVNAEASFFSVLNGKFSAGLERTKMHNVYDQTVTTRVQVKYFIYSVKAKPYFTFDNTFKKQLMDIANYLENNQTREAKYLAEMLILNYGTHVLTSVDAGATLIQEDQVKFTYVEDYVSQKQTVTGSATINFFDKVNIGIGGGTSSQQEAVKKYIDNTVDSKIESHGSVPFYPGITLQKWQEGTPNHLVAIGKFGLPIPFFINTETLPHLPHPTVKRLAKTVEQAIRLYYAINTHPGCITSDSPNFNFQANVDDGTCQQMNTNFTFGGMYQECHGISGYATESICKTYRTKNLLTGDFSCPVDYTAILLHSEEKTVVTPDPECHEKCHSCWLFFSCCHTECGIVYHTSKAVFSAYWCAASGIVPQSSGYLFGGLYSKDLENPVSRTHSCPSFFFPLDIFDNLKVCVSDDYEMGFRYSVPFGGFTSCQSGNPLAGTLMGQSPGVLQDFFYQGNPTSYPMKCPKGFTQHLAYISDGCEVRYCIKAGTLFEKRLPSIKLPPFTNPPIFNISSRDTLYVLNPESGGAWVKDLKTQMWKIADASDETNFIQLFQTSSTKQSNGVAVGISVAVVVVVVVFVISVIVVKRRRYKSQGYSEIHHASDIGDQPSYGTAESTQQSSAISVTEDA